MKKVIASKPFKGAKTWGKKKMDMATAAQTILAAKKFISSIPFLSQKIYMLGERGSGTKPRGELQDYEKIVQECLRKEILWEDPIFPADDKSMFYSEPPDTPFIWKRPKEIESNATFVEKGFSRFDVNQGGLGDCWFLSAIASLALHRNVFFRVVPEHQSFTDRYTGVFHFRFWQIGRWIDVVIDDRLPVKKATGKLIYVRSTASEEFWIALLEKAYAKLHGTYEALKAGISSEALEDFTGGVAEFYYFEDLRVNLFAIMLYSHEKGSLMCAGLNTDPDHPGEHQLSNGLVKGHGYTVISVKRVNTTNGPVKLVRLRNPWGTGEWNGPWSDRSDKWLTITDKMKDDMELAFDPDGEFWMPYEDFLANFTHIEICHVSTWSFSEIQLNKKKSWETNFIEGEWVRGVSAGGSLRYDSFLTNPQYFFTLTESDETDSEQGNSVILSLVQKSKRSERYMGAENIAFMMYVIRVKNPESAPKPLGINYFTSDAFVYGNCTGDREIVARLKIKRGTYCIIPATAYPNDEAGFLLRTFTEKRIVVEENDVSPFIGKTDKQALIKDKRILDKGKIFFKKVAGIDKEIDWMELKDLLDFSLKSELGDLEFSKDICRSMVAMMDTDLSGKLGYDEFKILWTDLCNWQAAFKLHDEDGTKTLKGFQLREALYSAGYRLNNDTLNILMLRYGTKEGFIMFDDFIMCAIRVKTMIELFRDKDPFCVNEATFTLEEWLQKSLYC